MLIRAWLTLAVVVVAACGEESGSDSSTASSASGDNRYHPPTNGVQITEDAACARLQGAFSARIQELSCIKTVRPCPSFLQAKYDPDCMQYDEGTVAGCEAHYKMQTCETLLEDSCVLVGYPETAPTGCAQ